MVPLTNPREVHIGRGIWIDQRFRSVLAVALWRTSVTASSNKAVLQLASTESDFGQEDVTTSAGLLGM